MAKKYNLKPAPSKDSIGDDEVATGTKMNRRQFLRYGFNSAAGVMVASIGALGFASIIMPGGTSEGADSEVKYWAKGREDSAWYGPLHDTTMKKSDFEKEAEKSVTGISGAAGVWMGLPVTVLFVPDSKNKDLPLQLNKPRFQTMEGYTAQGSGSYVGHFEDLSDVHPELFPSDDIIMIFSRCSHLCCIPGWQLVSRTETEDNWTPGGGDDGGSRLFCICHSSRFDPTALEMNENRNRANGQKITFAGIRRTGGPAPMGIPIIPVKINGDIIEGIDTFSDWLTYCD